MQRLPTAREIAAENRLLRAFQAEADAVAVQIVNTDLPWVDVAIQVNQLRAHAADLFPGRGALFEMIYASRFVRLWEQWRGTPCDGF